MHITLTDCNYGETIKNKRKTENIQNASEYGIDEEVLLWDELLNDFLLEIEEEENKKERIKEPLEKKRCVHVERRLDQWQSSKRPQ